MSLTQDDLIEPDEDDYVPSENQIASSLSIPDNPNEQLGFEINPLSLSTQDIEAFIPEFYPDDFTQIKKRELKRYGASCGTESVSIKSQKNREFHAEGVMLQSQISTFHDLLDHNGKVTIYSPLTVKGGTECYVKQGELGNESGFDPVHSERLFEYRLDLVSTGRDERKSGENAIVTAITK